MSEHEKTPAMRYRALRSRADERSHAEAMLPGSGLPHEEALAHWMAKHESRIAWAEVEYQAWLGGNSVGLTRSPLVRSRMVALLDAAYAADAAEVEAHRAVRLAEVRAERRR